MGTATCAWLRTDSTRAMSFCMRPCKIFSCLIRRPFSTFSISASVRVSSPTATALRSSLSLSYFSTSRYCISKRSSSACLSSSSPSSSVEPPDALPASALRRRASAAARWSLMKGTKSFKGSFPAVWFRMNLVPCESSGAVGTFTPSTVFSVTTTGCTGCRTSRGARDLFSRSLVTVPCIASRVLRPSATASSDWTPCRTSSLATPGWHEPTTLTVTGSKSNCAMLNCSSVREVRCLDGLKVTTMLVEPSGGITPVSGEIVKSGCSSRTVISNSN
mmetsp:Transcript_51597/g.136307  ORF Transcript_51597/g.136307 Transcript_51597/m.136307 type:complete len:275 (+) Transcript_51597:758-1582(+)